MHKVCLSQSTLATFSGVLDRLDITYVKFLQNSFTKNLSNHLIFHRVIHETVVYLVRDLRAKSLVKDVHNFRVFRSLSRAYHFKKSISPLSIFPVYVFS